MAQDNRPAASAYAWSYASGPAGSAPSRSALRASGSSQMASTMSAGNPALRRHTSRHTLHVVPGSGTRCQAPAGVSAAPPCVIACPSLTLSAATQIAEASASVSVTNCSTHLADCAHRETPLRASTEKRSTPTGNKVPNQRSTGSCSALAVTLTPGSLIPHPTKGLPLVAPNLTRAEARERAALIKVTSYQVDLDLTLGDVTFGSQSVIRFSCAAPGAGTFVNLTAPAVSKITLNGEPVAPGAFDGERIALAGLTAENVVVVDAECAYSRSGEGLHRFVDPADGNVYLYSDLETFKAHRIYACFDQPDMKASYQLSVTAPTGWDVVSNMAPRSDEAVAGPAGSGAARRRRLPATPPMPTYITHVSAGPYHVVRDEHDGIPLGIYCRQSLAEYLDPDELFTITKQGFDFFHSSFGSRYPFGKYDQLFVPEFKAGAMENAGAVTILEDYVFRSRVTDVAREVRGVTILHEMAHMWF